MSSTTSTTPVELGGSTPPELPGTSVTPAVGKAGEVLAVAVANGKAGAKWLGTDADKATAELRSLIERGDTHAAVWAWHLYRDDLVIDGRATDDEKRAAELAGKRSAVGWAELAGFKNGQYVAQLRVLGIGMVELGWSVGSKEYTAFKKVAGKGEVAKAMRALADAPDAKPTVRKKLEKDARSAVSKAKPATPGNGQNGGQNGQQGGQQQGTADPFGAIDTTLTDALKALRQATDALGKGKRIPAGKASAIRARLAELSSALEAHAPAPRSGASGTVNGQTDSARKAS
jgi:hypothetical protein